MDNLLSSRNFKITIPFLGISILIASAFYVRLFIEKIQEKLKRYKNEVQQINIKRPSKPEEPSLQHIQLNNVAYNPQIVSTFSLTITLIIALVFTLILYISFYYEYFTSSKMLKLGVHRVLLSFAVPLFFYCTDSSLRRFVFVLYSFGT